MIYARDVERTSGFYEQYFDLRRVDENNSEMVTLIDSSGEEIIRIHQAGKAVKMGQAAIKLIFEVSDVDKFKLKSLTKGLKFGATHRGPGYQFANVKDPDGNGIQITTRKRII